MKYQKKKRKKKAQKKVFAGLKSPWIVLKGKLIDFLNPSVSCAI